MASYSQFRKETHLTQFPSKSNKTLRDIAIETAHDNNNVNDPTTNQAKERTIMIIGSKGVGKTSLIHRFLDRDEAPKPTLALEYTYGRKSRKSFVKDICHIWELGGGTLLSGLLDAPLASLDPDGIEQLSIILMLDLSAPHQLWFTLETLLQAIINTINRHVGSDMQKLQELAWKPLGKDHSDEAYLDPFPIPLIILGGKYDLFQEFDPEKKKAVCRSLRYVAHTLGATLLFYCIKEPGIVKRAKDLLSWCGFGTAPMKSISQDYNKPLLIPAGSDSMQQIGGVNTVGLPPRNKSGASGPGAALEYWKHTFTAHFPQDISTKTAMPEDPCSDINYEEPEIDELRAQKDDELRLYRAQLEKKAEIRAEFYLDPEQRVRM